MSLLGASGINSRIAELQTRLDSLTPQAEPTPVGADSFQAQLDNAQAAIPMDPFNPMGGAPVGEIQGMIGAAAAKNNVDPKLLTALVHQESGGNPNAVSHCGAQGLCQLMPKTAAGLGVLNPFDPAENLNGGAKYLKQQLDKFGRTDLALAAYNAGPKRIEGKGFAEWPGETQNYVTSIMARMKNP